MNTRLKNRLIVESSFPGTLALLLEGPEEAGKLISTAQKAFDVRNKKFTSIIGGLPGGPYKDVLSKSKALSFEYKLKKDRKMRESILKDM